MAAVGHIEVREAHSPVADHRDAARLQRLERCAHITDRLGPRTDQHEGPPAQFVQLGGGLPRRGPRRRARAVPPGAAFPARGPPQVRRVGKAVRHDGGFERDYRGAEAERDLDLVADVKGTLRGHEALPSINTVPTSGWTFPPTPRGMVAALAASSSTRSANQPRSRPNMTSAAAVSPAPVSLMTGPGCAGAAARA